MNLLGEKVIVPDTIMSKYPRKSRMKFPNGKIVWIDVPDAVFVDDHNEEREYWKGFELVDWGYTKELRCMYWTRKRGVQKWTYGQFTTIISFEKLKQLISIIDEKGWFQ